MKIILLGGGGEASDVLAALDAVEGASGVPGTIFTVLGYLADGSVDYRRFESRELKHLGAIDALGQVGATHYISCVGYPAGRRKLARIADAVGLQPFTVVHPRAWVPPTAVIGPGSVVLAGSCLSPLTRLGAHVLVGQGAVLGHDCQVGDYASVMPGACVSGDTVIGADAVIGANATVIEKHVIGEGAFVGAGAVVTHDVPDWITVVGNPAKSMQERPRRKQ